MKIKNRTYYFYNDLINMKGFNASFLELDKKYQWVLVFSILVISQKVLSGKLIV